MRILISVLALGGGLLPLTPASAAPAPGTCWNLTGAQQVQPTLPTAVPVDCSMPHNAELLGVVRGAAVTAVDTFQRCQAVAVEYLGGVPVGGPDPSTYSLPRTAGLTVYLSGNRKRAYCVGLNTTSRGVVKARVGSVRDTGLKPRVCFNSVTWKRASCGGPKAVDLPHVVWLSSSATEAYPGDARAMKRTQRLCTRFARSWGYVAEAWYLPGATQWNLGNRYAYCRAVPDQTDTGWSPTSAG